MQAYLKTRDSLGKAGAYSIQGEGAHLIEKIEGDYPTVVGLPLRRLAKFLEEAGITTPVKAEEIYQTKPYANWPGQGTGAVGNYGPGDGRGQRKVYEVYVANT